MLLLLCKDLSAQHRVSVELLWGLADAIAQNTSTQENSANDSQLNQIALEPDHSFRASYRHVMELVSHADLLSKGKCWTGLSNTSSSDSL